MEIEFGNVEWSDHICAYKVSFSMRRRQGCEENVAVVGQGWQLPPTPTLTPQVAICQSKVHGA